MKRLVCTCLLSLVAGASGVVSTKAGPAPAPFDLLDGEPAGYIDLQERLTPGWLGWEASGAAGHATGAASAGGAGPATMSVAAARRT